MLEKAKEINSIETYVIHDEMHYWLLSVCYTNIIYQGVWVLLFQYNIK
jgi:hypothetical protein